MPDYLTPKDAAALDCPVARLHTEPQRNCRADACMFWRWRPLAVTPEWAKAFEAAAAKHKDDYNRGRDEKIDLRAAKVHVREHLADFGLAQEPTEGWCGLAGEPRG